MNIIGHTYNSIVMLTFISSLLEKRTVEIAINTLYVVQYGHLNVSSKFRTFKGLLKSRIFVYALVHLHV